MEDIKGIVKELADFLKKRYKPDLDKHGGTDSKFLLLHCIDYRYPKAIHEALDKILPGRYDQLVLAGAALAGVIDFGVYPKPHWSQTLLEHIHLSMTLPHHEIKSILVLEHKTCGAYKQFGLISDDSSDQDEEDEHKLQVDRFANLVKATFPRARLLVASY